MPNPLNIVGEKYGRLKVVSFHKKDVFYFWNCVCDCGNKKIVKTSKLREGSVSSCGCIRKGLLKTHGMSKTPFFMIYHGLKNRCNNPQKRYRYWNGKGIRCKWNTFEDFKKDMHKSYLDHIKKYGVKNTSLDRTDGNKDYCKSNCSWVTKKQQQNNMSNNIAVTYKGKKLGLYEWEKITNISYSVLWKRLFRDKWEVSRALTQPLKIHKRQQ